VLVLFRFIGWVDKRQFECFEFLIWNSVILTAAESFLLWIMFEIDGGDGMFVGVGSVELSFKGEIRGGCLALFAY